MWRTWLINSSVSILVTTHTIHVQIMTKSIKSAGGFPSPGLNTLQADFMSFIPFFWFTNTRHPLYFFLPPSTSTVALNNSQTEEKKTKKTKQAFFQPDKENQKRTRWRVLEKFIMMSSLRESERHVMEIRQNRTMRECVCVGFIKASGSDVFEQQEGELWEDHSCETPFETRTRPEQHSTRRIGGQEIGPLIIQEEFHPKWICSDSEYKGWS